ncbi:hydroxylase [Gordonia sp. zg691]|uniref:Hydroxylase n=1 Tax=Gordonia jinghuaiqii TaxID=2758710 RepID=A0A7D7LP70_9ACTN|nr:acyl-CoA dehydrogenase family protein [Gordonia jinghuaiqii]MBD0862559.1 hydroxylase [Gordonia jinghuaiqii]MCR5976660.1 hydroxylase [Gordonia jinghuaiqii]QMS99839.1 hydroxylase [Gordonia jinghuaiqii]
MGHVLDNIMRHADEIRAEAVEGEKLMQLTDVSAKRLRDSGVVRMLQPKEYGGLECHPREFAETVMATAALDGATGWVAGIVGVHPWALAAFDDKAQNEIWGADNDMWMASPYAPMGVAVPVDGGYVLNGRWAFSSGTDHCGWVMIGAAVGDKDGNRTGQVLHVVLPRSDYEIDADSWNVMGLRGTGSKDLIVKDAFIPTYRTIDAAIVLGGEGWKHAGRDETLYKFPFSYIFPLGITSALIGMTEGALACYIDAQKERVQVSGIPIKEDPYVLFAISDAAAEIAASRITLLETVDRFWDKTDRGEEISFEERAAGRRTQVSAAWRAVRAMDEIFARAGGLSTHLSNPIQRFWRDAHVGLTHAIHVPGLIYHSAALAQLGGDPQGAYRAMI